VKVHARAPAPAPAKQDAAPKARAPRRDEPRAHEAAIDPTRIPAALRAIIDGRPAPASLSEDGTLLVDTAAGDNQLHKSEFLTQLKAGVVAAAEQELVGTGWTAEHCPYIEYWFKYYSTRSAADVEAALRKYAPAAAEATTASAYLEPALARVREAVRHWRATGAVDAPPAAVPSVVESMAELGVGRPLESSTRTRLEGALDVDLSSTRVHDDALGARASADAGARALTIGSHVAFAGGEYAPGTLRGDALLAHELAHAQQQADATGIATSTDHAAAEAGADRFAAGALARLAGFSRPALPLAPARGLALQRCKMGYDPEFEYRMGETKQQTWLRTFREDHPGLEKIGWQEGPRDEGIMSESGIRVPKKKGNMLEPRKFYERWLGQFFAYQGFIHYAELAEAGHDAAALKQAQSLYSRTGRQIPNDRELDLDSYDHWTKKAAHARDNVAAAITIADLSRTIHGLWRLWKAPPPGVVSGQFTVKPVRPTPDAPPPPKVIVEPQAPPPKITPQPPPKVTPEPPPKVTPQPPPKVTPEPPPKVTPEPPPKVTPEPPPKVTPEPPPKVTPEPPAVAPKGTNRGYTGKWPPDPPGPRPGKNATAQDMADWRYKRYVHEQYKAGKPPDEILTREGHAPHAKAAGTPNARPGRAGGPAQRATRQGPAADEGFQNTETTQLGTRTDPKTNRVEKNMVDGVRKNDAGGTDYLEVDKINKNGLPPKDMRDKLKAEIQAMKPGDTLEYWDKTDPSRRIRYKHGDAPSVVDERKATTLPRKKRNQQ
jgi:hypothetical protein